MPLSYRAFTHDDSKVCSFPQNAEELFYISPTSEYPWTPEALLRKSLERSNPTVVYDTDTGERLAYANLYDLNAEESCCWLGNVMVSPAARGRGVGGYLLEAMVEQAVKVHGLNRLRLYCHNINTGALMLYLKHGFVPNGGYKWLVSPADVKIVCIELERKLNV